MRCESLVYIVHSRNISKTHRVVSDLFLRRELAHLALDFHGPLLVHGLEAAHLCHFAVWWSSSLAPPQGPARGRPQLGEAQGPWSPRSRVIQLPVEGLQSRSILGSRCRSLGFDSAFRPSLLVRGLSPWCRFELDLSEWNIWFEFPFLIKTHFLSVPLGFRGDDPFYSVGVLGGLCRCLLEGDFLKLVPAWVLLI